MAHGLRSVVALLVALVGCDDEPSRLDWHFVFSAPQPREDADRIVAEVIRGGCGGGEVVFRSVLGPSGGSAAPSPLEPGTYGLAGRALDGACRVVATGCVPVRLPQATGRVEVPLEEAPSREPCAPAEACGGCVPVDAGPVDAGPFDGGVDAEMPPCEDPGPDATRACPGGATIFPVYAWDVSDDFGAGGFVCDPCGARLPDGAWAGLDRDQDSPGNVVDVDGMSATACLALDFGGEVEPSTLRLRLQTASQGCASEAACDPADCGDGSTVRIYMSDTAGEWNHLINFNEIPDSWEDYLVDFALGQRVRWIMACRTGFGASRSDPWVDYVSLVCRP